MTARDYSSIDNLLINLDQAIRTVFGRPQTTGRGNPAGNAEETDLLPADQQQSARLLRVNHCGEICAQALYQGQALTARNEAVRERLEQAAAEESDHLDWCAARLRELDDHTSLLNPLFYAGSFAVGTLSGTLGDRWNLGFLAETEHQVVRHLETHLERMSSQDHKSRAILEAMKDDEDHHATMAREAGGARLPLPARLLMQAAAKLMTKTTYWI